MELLTFGHSGARVLVFPTSLAPFFEWEDREMVAVLADQIENGWLQLFCVGSVDSESWYAKHKHPHERAERHQQYENYLLGEVLPFTQHRNPNPYLIATGCSFGAYHAANLAFRHPHLVNRVIALSGLYDIKEMTSGYSDPLVYAHDPSQYLLHASDPARLEALGRMDIVIATGEEDPFVGNNVYLSQLLWQKGIWHALRLWDGWSHDWPYWQQMIRQYIGGSD